MRGVAMRSVDGLTFALLGGSIFGIGALPFMVGSGIRRGMERGGVRGDG